jgi:hypothetical protein
MLRLLIALAATIALGIASRQSSIGIYLFDKSVGDVLYAVAAYLVLALVLYRRQSSLIALLAFGLCLAVELFKLTGIPAKYGDSQLVRWVLGTGFSWHNLACYAIGVTAMFGLDVKLLRR